MDDEGVEEKNDSAVTELVTQSPENPRTQCSYCEWGVCGGDNLASLHVDLFLPWCALPFGFWQ